MIDKVGATAMTPSAEQQQIAKSNNLDWDRYVQKIEDLKTNPPREFAVTMPYFTWYHQTEFPAWYANELTATGVSKSDIPPTYDKQLIVTESYLNDLQNQVPGYLKDIVEIDPRTKKPLVPKENVGNVTNNSTQSQQTASALATTTTATTTSTAPTATKAATATTASTTTSQTSQSQSSQSPSFDFTKLSPGLQETALRLAEQLLDAALQRLSGASQTDAQLSTLFDRTV